LRAEKQRRGRDNREKSNRERHERKEKNKSRNRGNTHREEEEKKLLAGEAAPQRTATLFGRRITSATASATIRSVAPLPASSFSYSHALFAPVTTVLQSEQWGVFLLFTRLDWPKSKCIGPGTS
jgi:hypothetical protein